MDWFYKKLRLGRKRVMVKISCPHGEFIPGAYLPGKGKKQTYACGKCMMTIKLSTYRGPIYW